MVPQRKLARDIWACLEDSPLMESGLDVQNDPSPGLGWSVLVVQPSSSPKSPVTEFTDKVAMNGVGDDGVALQLAREFRW
ncbi:hypothetical protein ACLOJK_039770 [Asimina triloba]